MVTMFINNMMYSGKKGLAYQLFYGAMDIIDEKDEEGGYEVWKKAVDTAMPQVEVRSRRIGGATCLLYTSPSPRDGLLSRMPSSA